MLTHLTIDRMAVIEHAELTLGDGMTVLTGETGAGKSILIDALCAVLGERTSRELVRSGSAYASVSASFDHLPDAVVGQLEAFGYFPETDGTLLLRRRISAENKSACYIGAQPCTAAVLREIGRMLVNIHGQHESQALLNQEKHVGYLDRLGGIDPVRLAYEDTYRRYCDTHRRLRKLRDSEEQKARRQEILDFQIEELTSAALTEGEEESLSERRDLLKNGERVERLLHEALLLQEGNEEEMGALVSLEQAAFSLREAGSVYPPARELADKLESLVYELRDESASLRKAAEDAAFDPEELDAVEERLTLVHRLCAKYGGSTASALAYLASAIKERQEIECSDEEIRILSERLLREREELLDAASELTSRRKASAQVFCDQVSAQLRALDMPHVRLEVAVSPTSLTATGADRVEFLISANPGEPPRPLAKIASGGELSRIMLALKSVMATVDEIPTLIFDEVDAGISGSAAVKVGDRLRSLAHRAGKQVLCVTHLPQIAARADRHLAVIKEVRDGRTFTRVLPLDREGRVRALAGLIDGMSAPSAMQTAREMLDRTDNDTLFEEKN